MLHDRYGSRACTFQPNNKDTLCQIFLTSSQDLFTDKSADQSDLCEYMSVAAVALLYGCICRVTVNFILRRITFFCNASV